MKKQERIEAKLDLIIAMLTENPSAAPIALSLSEPVIPSPNELERKLIEKYFSKPAEDENYTNLTATDIKLHIEKNSIQRVSLTKIGQEMKALGYKSKSFRRYGTPAQGYSVIVKDFVNIF